VNHNFTKNFQIQGSYTPSRLISATTNQDTKGHAHPVYNVLNIAAERALATQDQPNAVTINSVWQMPFFPKSTNGFLRNSLGGWELNGMYSARSGLPINVCLDRDVVGLARAQICERPDVISNPNLSADKRTITQYFNAGSFVLQTPDTFGNAGRNIVRGPGLNNIDMSLF
jgi:hypothetical protein